MYTGADLQEGLQAYLAMKKSDVGRQLPLCLVSVSVLMEYLLVRAVAMRPLVSGGPSWLSYVLKLGSIVPAFCQASQ